MPEALAQNVVQPGCRQTNTPTNALPAATNGEQMTPKYVHCEDTTKKRINMRFFA